MCCSGTLCLGTDRPRTALVGVNNISIQSLVSTPYFTKYREHRATGLVDVCLIHGHDWPLMSKMIVMNDGCGKGFETNPKLEQSGPTLLHRSYGVR